MILRPINENVLIEVSKLAEKTKSGIVIPDNARKKPGEGKIIAVDVKNKYDLKIGDIVLFDRFSGIEIKVEEKDYLMMKTELILARKIIGGSTS